MILSSAEERHGLPPGALRSAVLEDAQTLSAVTTGAISDDEWRSGIGHRLQGRFGRPGLQAVREWSESVGEVDSAVLELVRRERRQGRPVAILSNATDRLRSDLRRLGLDVEVDAILNSSELGVAKPDREVFRQAARVMGVPLRGCLFVDDTPEHVDAAAELGIVAHHYVGPAALAEFFDRHRRET